MTTEKQHTLESILYPIWKCGSVEKQKFFTHIKIFIVISATHVHSYSISCYQDQCHNLQHYIILYCIRKHTTQVIKICTFVWQKGTSKTQNGIQSGNSLNQFVFCCCCCCFLLFFFWHSKLRKCRVFFLKKRLFHHSEVGSACNLVYW